MRAVQIQQRHRLHAIDMRPGRRAPWPWRARLFYVGVWAAFVVVGTVVVAVVLSVGYGLFLLGEHAVRAGAGW